MEWNMTIFNSEIEFRHSVILNSVNISHIFVFEDVLECSLYFYCFFKNHAIVAAHEDSSKGFLFYKDVYLQLAEKLQLCAGTTFNRKNAIVIVG